MVDAMQVCVDAARAIDTTIPIGWEGAEPASPMDSYDYWLQTQVMGSIEAYDIGNSPEYTRAFRDNQYGQRVFRFITMFDAGSDQRNRYKLWFDLIHYGMRGSIIWWYENFFTDTSSYNLTNYALGLAPAYGEFRNGLAKLLSQGERDDGEVALYYSQRSNHISWQFDSEVDGRTWIKRLGSYDSKHSAFVFTHIGWLKVLEDIGLKGRFVSYEQVAGGELIDKGYKVLVMPRLMAISDDELAAVQAFAEAGGLVIGDAQTGVYDGHCKRRSIAAGGGLMDEWFGIERVNYFCTERNRNSSDAYSGLVELQTPPPGFEALIDDLPSSVPEDAGFHAVEDGVRVGDGTAVGLFGGYPDKPVLIVKDHGAGKSVYMNLTMHRYGSAHVQDGTWDSSANYTEERLDPDSDAAKNVRQLVKNLMALGGVAPRVNVLQGHGAADPPAGAEVYNLEAARYVDGDNVYLACVVNSFMQEPTENWSDPAHHPDPAAELFGQPGVSEADVTLVLDGPAHVYDVRKRMYLGYGTRIDAAQPVLEGGVFALLPYQVTGLSLDSISFDSKRRASLTVSVQTAGGSPGRHVFRMEAFEQSGQEMKHLARNVVAPGGVWSGVIPFAVDANLRGGWIKITDLATGVDLQYYMGQVAPVINQVTPDPDTIIAGGAYAKQMTLLEGNPPITWSLIQGPAGAVIDQDGLVSGWTTQTAQIDSTYTFEVRAQNADGSDTETWEVTVVAPVPVIAQVSPDPDSALTGMEYVRQLNLLQGDCAGLTWRLLQAPGGATIDTNGLISGWVPQISDMGQSYSFAARARNGQGAGTAAWQVYVMPAALSLEIVGPPQIDEMTPMPYRAMVEFANGLLFDGSAQCTWSLSPSGLLSATGDPGVFVSTNVSGQQTAAIEARYTDAYGTIIKDVMAVVVRDLAETSGGGDDGGGGDGAPAAQETPPGCCGAAGPVAPLGLAVGLLLLHGVGRRRRIFRGSWLWSIVVLLCMLVPPALAGTVHDGAASGGSGCEPDDYASGTDISTMCPGVTLSTSAGGAVYSQDSLYNSTGARVFGTSSGGGSGNTWCTSFYFRADFDSPLSIVSIDVIGDDSSDYGYLAAYDSNDVEIDRDITGDLTVNDVETLTVTSAGKNIAYVEASGTTGDCVELDALVYDAAWVTAPTSLTGVSLIGIGLSATYTAGGSVSSEGDVVEYQFDFGDGRQSAWGAATATYSWSAPGTYAVAARARSVADNTIVSGWSTPLIVEVRAEVLSVSVIGPTVMNENAPTQFRAEAEFADGETCDVSDQVQWTASPQFLLLPTGDPGIYISGEVESGERIGWIEVTYGDPLGKMVFGGLLVMVCDVATVEPEHTGWQTSSAAAQETPSGCCGAAGPVVPFGLAVGFVLLSRGSARRRRFDG